MSEIEWGKEWIWETYKEDCFNKKILEYSTLTPFQHISGLSFWAPRVKDECALYMSTHWRELWSHVYTGVRCGQAQGWGWLTPPRRFCRGVYQVGSEPTQEASADRPLGRQNMRIKGWNSLMCQIPAYCWANGRGVYVCEREREMLGLREGRGNIENPECLW